MMEQFLNAHEEPFSKIYLRISGFTSIETVQSVGRRMFTPRIIMSPAQLSNFTSNILLNNNLLYKVRTVFFEQAIPTYSNQVAGIIKRAWLSNIDQHQFDSQNGLRLSVSIVNVAHYINNMQNEVLGFSYTISVNGQDPESIPIAEPTYDVFRQETEYETERAIHLAFSSYNAYEIDRVYIVTELNDAELTELLNTVLTNAWKALNNHTDLKYMAQNRITDLKKIKGGLITENNERLVRVSLAYLVDGNVPNPIKFSKPSVSDLIPLFTKAGVTIYDGIALLPDNIVIHNFNESLNDKLELAIIKAYSEQNPDLKSDMIYVEIDKHKSKRSIDAHYEPNIEYRVGINDHSFDVIDVQKPSVEVLQRAIRAQVPDAVFDQQTADIVKKTDNRNIWTVIFNFIFE